MLTGLHVKLCWFCYTQTVYELDKETVLKQIVAHKFKTLPKHFILIHLFIFAFIFLLIYNFMAFLSCPCHLWLWVTRRLLHQGLVAKTTTSKVFIDGFI